MNRHNQLPQREGGLMKTPLKDRVDLDNVSPEVKSYIYQVISEFEPFTTSETQIAVIAKDPLKLITQLEANGVDYDRTELKKMYRISITLSEDGAKVEEEGLHEDIFAAIRLAKDNMLKTLAEIQDSVVSNQDRTMQINEALSNGTVH